MKVKSIIIPCLLLTATMTLNTSCEDMLTQDSDNVIYADNEHLISATDTIYSVIGIMNKMQAIADRTVLFGELRGDLADVSSNATSDLRDISLFNVGDSNVYNSPKDYYAVINNCNYFLAKADTALRNNRNVKIFEKEYAAVKAYRAWTYLQLVLNYGKVPFVIDPVLSEEDANKTYPMYGINEICTYFAKDIAPYADVELPGYGTIRSMDSRMFYIPIYVLLGDLNLWAGNYKEAAVDYYKYIDSRELYVGSAKVAWGQDETKYTRLTDSYSRSFSSETYAASSEVVSMIPMDSVESEGNFSTLRDLFNSTENNNYKYSIVPSQAMLDLSEAQLYCNYASNGAVSYIRTKLDDHLSGDLRLYSNWEVEDHRDLDVPQQTINKYSTKNVRIYRKSEIYLHLAEALNRAGYPRFAFEILKDGLNNSVIESKVLPYYNSIADSTWISQFDFPNTVYITNTASAGRANTIGIHSHGSGYTEYNEYYAFPTDSTLAPADTLNYQIKKVEDMIIDEDALEMSFEGKRFYDLMRVALRRNDPSYLANRVYNRRGADNKSIMVNAIKKDLNTVKNWYFNWKDKIGY